MRSALHKLNFTESDVFRRMRCMEISTTKVSFVSVLQALNLWTYLTLTRVRHGVLVSRHGVLQIRRFCALEVRGLSSKTPIY